VQDASPGGTVVIAEGADPVALGTVKGELAVKGYKVEVIRNADKMALRKRVPALWHVLGRPGARRYLPENLSITTEKITIKNSRIDPEEPLLIKEKLVKAGWKESDVTISQTEFVEGGAPAPSPSGTPSAPKGGTQVLPSNGTQVLQP
jgi:hypothetical protein